MGECLASFKKSEEAGVVSDGAKGRAEELKAEDHRENGSYRNL